MQDGAYGRLLVQVDTGTDCIVDGAPVPARRLVARAAAALADRAEIIRLESPGEELGLSSLLAQISGRPDFDAQDDAVLELGFKRLTALGRRTVLVLDAPQGIALAAIRYLQHVGRSAPELVLVVLGSPALDAALEQPGAAPLRARLRAGPAIWADDEPAAIPALAAASLPEPPAEIPKLVAPPGPIPLSSPQRRRVRLLPWAAAAVSIAAASVIVVQLSRVPQLEVPVTSSVVSSAVAPVVAPVVASVPEPVQTSTVLEPAPVAVETPVVIPPADKLPPLTVPAPAPAAPLPALTKPDHVLHARRADPKPRLPARAGRFVPEWQPDEAAASPWDGLPPWRHRAPRWGDQPYPGGYVYYPYATPLYPLSR